MMTKTGIPIPFRAYTRHAQAGVSLIDLMVGLAVGLIVTLVVISALGTMSMQRRNAVSGDDAKESGQAALMLIERAAKLAGAGLFYNGQLICSRLNAYNTALLANGDRLAPAFIADGGSTGSDTITFAYANAVGGSTVAHLVDDMASPNVALFTANNRGNLAEGDLALVGVPGSDRPCTMFQVTGFTGVIGGSNCNDITSSCVKILRNSGESDFNPTNPDGIYSDAPRYGRQTSGGIIGPAVITRLGALDHQTYRVMCNALVSHSAFASPACIASPLAFTDAIPLAGNIVMLKAQYGITDSAASDVVTSWVNATGATWSAPDAAAIPRIKAIRIAVVSRGTEPGIGTVTSACTNAAGVVNVGPCSFQDANSPVINLSAVPVPSGKTWQNYRYRVFHSVIPLRTVLWNY
jgi:type IV pilus assembly protein PilW